MITKVLSVGRVPLKSLEEVLEKTYYKKENNSYFTAIYY